MTSRMTAPAPATKANLIDGAVVRREARAGARLLDKAFALAFKGLVYAQIWEDPVADMEALALDADSRILTIASGAATRCPISPRTRPR
ncbi:hypothetical protein MBENS4_3155 [Novosphingobium sp. MBES04]|nr:hypothetical protein MBENS4_3155 [Novosphingobium sp. MBES04]